MPDRAVDLIKHFEAHIINPVLGLSRRYSEEIYRKFLGFFPKGRVLYPFRGKKLKKIEKDS